MKLFPFIKYWKVGLLVTVLAVTGIGASASSLSRMSPSSTNVAGVHETRNESQTNSQNTTQTQAVDQAKIDEASKQKALDDAKEQADQEAKQKADDQAKKDAELKAEQDKANAQAQVTTNVSTPESTPVVQNNPAPTCQFGEDPTYHACYIEFKGNGKGPSLCKDGMVSHSAGSGTCSGHGGVQH